MEYSPIQMLQNLSPSRLTNVIVGFWAAQTCLGSPGCVSGIFPAKMVQILQNI